MTEKSAVEKANELKVKAFNIGKKMAEMQTEYNKLHTELQDINKQIEVIEKGGK